MLGILPLSYALIVPTVLTGLLLLYIEKRPPIIFINLAINAWIFMNCLWMLGDTLGRPSLLYGARVSLVMGLIFIAFAVALSKDLRDTFSHFKRFRLFKTK